jgi:hypothetical protein
MSTSTILLLSAVGCGLLFAGCAVLAQSGGGVPRWQRVALPAAILAFCSAFGGLAFLIDDDVAETTLFEVDAEVPAAPGPAALSFDVPVEHTDAEHELFVAPTDGLDMTEPVALRVRLTDPSGRVLVDEPVTLDPRCDEFCEWDSFGAVFTPARTGPHVLEVTVPAPDVALLHVRVGDPLKTDGQRAPGY